MFKIHDGKFQRPFRIFRTLSPDKFGVCDARGFNWTPPRPQLTRAEAEAQAAKLNA